MKSVLLRGIIMGIIFLMLISHPLSNTSLAYTTNMEAAVVIGQPNFTSSGANQNGSVSANGLDDPFSAVVIGGKLLISDANNNRVLIWNSIPGSNNVGADLVIGQTNMTNHSANQGSTSVNVAANYLSYPQGLATDGTKLFIADYNNHRVLIFNTVPTSNDASADLVIGQSNMTTHSAANPPTSSSLSSPTGIAYHTGTGKLFISDSGNSRILIYNSIPTSNGVAADVVVGHNLFTESTSECSQKGFQLPYSVRIFNNKLFIADAQHRIMIWNTIPTSNYAAADLMIGKSSFTDCTYTYNTARDIVGPVDMAWDGVNLFVQDSGNSRVLIFTGIHTSSYPNADKVLGQPDLTTNSSSSLPVTRKNFGSRFTGGLLTVDRQLLVMDGASWDERVLIFNDDTALPSATPTPVPDPARCGDQLPGTVGNVSVVSRNNRTAAEVRWTPPSGASLAHIRYTDHLGSWPYSLVNTANDGVELISGLSQSAQYWFAVAGVNGCRVGPWSATFGPVPSGGGTPQPSGTPSASFLPSPLPSNASSPLPSVLPIPLPSIIPPEIVPPGIIPVIIGTITVIVSSLITTLLAYSAIASLGVGGLGAFGLTMRVFMDQILWHLSDILLWPLYVLGLLRKPRTSIGIVFDAVHHTPIEGAYVMFYSSSGNLKTTTTNASGRFMIRAEPDTYRVRVQKLGYVFPSQTLTIPHDGDFAMIYQYDQQVVVGGEPISNFALPMDPVSVDKFTFIIARLENGLNFIYHKLYFVGIGGLFLWSLYLVLQSSSLLHIASLVFIASILALSLVDLVRKQRDFGVVLDKASGKGLPALPLRLMTTDNEVPEVYTRTATDNNGRYLLTPENGNYHLQIFDTSGTMRVEKKYQVTDNSPKISEEIRI